MKKTDSIFIIILQMFSVLFNLGFLNNTKFDLEHINFFNISILIGLFIYYYKCSSKNQKLSKNKKILSHIISIFMIIGEIIKISGSLIFLLSPINIIITIIKYCGYVIVFNNLIKLLDYYIENKANIKIKNKLLKKYKDLLYEKPFLVSFISISIVFIIYIIAFYPIIMSKDPAYQIKMYYNIPTKYINWVIQRNPNIFMTNHHPILHTYLLGFCLDLGKTILNDNFGLFIYTFIQSLFLSTSLAYTIKFMKDRNIKPKYLLLILLIYLLTPMYGFYSVSAVKDTLYTVFFIHLILITYEIVVEKEKKISPKKLIYLFITIILLSLFRQNGKYIIYVLLPILGIYSNKNRIKIIVTFIIFLLTIYSFDKILIPHLGISDGSIREALSVPFQQTARLATYHDEIIEQNDKEIIDKLLTYNTLKQRYNPELSDKVKNEYNKNATTKDLQSYFKVWWKYLLKEPGCYIDATLNNNYGYFYPNSTKWYIYYNYDPIITEDNLVDYHYNKLDIIRKILISYGIIFPYIPVIGLLSNIGFGLFSILYIVASLIDKKKIHLIIILIPLIITILFCLVGPANTYFRYTMPYLFILPFLEVLLNKEEN